jgi:hypothetical protein
MGIEDTLKVEDVLKDPSDIILAKVYIQTLKTNGTVKNHEERIGKIEDCMDDKIGVKGITKLAVIVSFVLGLLMLISSTVGILNLIFGK